MNAATSELSAPHAEKGAELDDDITSEPLALHTPSPSEGNYGVVSDSSQQEASKIAELPVISAASFAGRDPPERPWIVEDMIPGRNVSTVAGDGGDGKTTLILQLAAAIAGNRPWLGHNPDPGPVLVVTAEDDEDEIHRRVAAIAKSLTVDLADLANLHIVPLAGLDAVMGAPEGRSLVITPTAVFRGLVTLVERFQPRLVVLDALADVYAGEENSRTQVRQFVSQLRCLAIKNELAVVLIVHPSLTGIASGNGTSGSTAWSNSVRARLYLERIKDERGNEVDADPPHLAGKEIKLRSHRSGGGSSRWFRRPHYWWSPR